MTKCKCKCKCTSTHWTCKTRSGNVHLPNYTFILRERFFLTVPLQLIRRRQSKSIVYKGKQCHKSGVKKMYLPFITSIRPTFHVSAPHTLRNAYSSRRDRK